MLSNNSTKRVGILFKEEVRTFDEKNIAGCERVFLDDVTFLKSRKLLAGAYMAAKNLSKESKNTSFIHTIAYPHHLLDKLQMLLERLPILRRLGHTFFKIFKLIVQLCYACAFIIKEFKSDVFYVIQVPLVGLFFPKKTTLFYHNFYEDQDFIFKFLYFFKKRAKYIKFVFVSQSLCDQYITKYPSVSQSICYVLPNSVNLKKFAPIEKKMDKISFIYLSAWVEEKGVFYLPKIVEDLNRKYKRKINFIIGGSTNLWSLSKDTYNRYLGIENRVYNLSRKYSNVNIIGLVNYNKVPEYLGASTFLLLPSTWDEPNSLLLKESISCGTPAIAFNVGGNKETIINGVNGYLVNRTSPDSMINIIGNIINSFNWTDYFKLSQNVRKSSIEYSQNERRKKLLEILLDCKP